MNGKLVSGFLVLISKRHTWKKEEVKRRIEFFVLFERSKVYWSTSILKLRVIKSWKMELSLSLLKRMKKCCPRHSFKLLSLSLLVLLSFSQSQFFILSSRNRQWGYYDFLTWIVLPSGARQTICFILTRNLRLYRYVCDNFRSLWERNQVFIASNGDKNFVHNTFLLELE